MAYVSAKEVMALKQSKPNTCIIDYSGNYGRLVQAKDIADEEHAQRIIDSALTATLANRHGKGDRPWNLVDITGKLDPTQPWLGFEYEMGVATREEYEKLINFVWRNIDHVAIDKEGYGTYCPEITFSPENLANYMNGTSAFQRTVKWMNENGVKMMNYGNHPVGTHLNVSTPAFRALFRDKQADVAWLIACSLITLTPEDHDKLFGRTAYGIGTPGEGAWIEFKIFASTDDLAKIDGYMQLGRRMSELIEAISRMGKAIPNYGPYAAVEKPKYIHNVVDILLGNTPAADMDIRAATGALPVSGWRRHGRGLNFNQYRNNTKKEMKNAA